MTAAEGRFERDYFETVYRDYQAQNPPRKLRFYRELVGRAARGIERPRILELGCAFGTFLASLGPGWTRFGIDVSAFALEEARRRVPEAELAVAPAGQVPFEGPFHVIAAFDVLEHVADLDAALDGVAARLTRGGALVLVVPVYDGPTGPLIRALDKDETHVHKEARRFWLERIGRRLSIEEWWGVFRYLLPGRLYAHWPTHALRAWAPAIAVVARSE